MTVQLYDGKYTVSFQESVHRYKVNGTYKTGVTTMLGILDKPNLIQWSANMAVQAMVEGKPPEEAKYAHRNRKEASADTGKLVHKWIEEHIQGNDLQISKDMAPSVQAFIKWEKENQPEYLASEQIVYSQSYDYCGTFDIMFKLNGKVYLADFKTSDPDQEFKRGYTGKTRARYEHMLQNALYDQALAEEKGQLTDAYMVIYVTKLGKLYTYENSDIDKLKETALSVVSTYKNIKELDRSNLYG